MLKKKILTHLIPTLLFLLLVSTFHWQLRFSLVFFWLGVFLGNFLLGLEGIFYSYFQAPHEFTSQRTRRLFTQRRFSEGLILVHETGDERRKMIFHSVLVQLVLLVVSFFVLTSSASLLGKGLVLGLFLHLLTDQGFEFAKNGQINNWFWQFKQKPATSLQVIYWVGILFSFLIFTLFLI